jgi:hypothetical protein
MSILPAQPPSLTLVFQPGATAQQTPLSGHIAQEGRQLDLQLNQIVRATVTEGGVNNVELDMNRLRFRASSKTPLIAGQKLQLQVIQTHPHIELKILDKAELQYLFRAISHFGQQKGFSLLWRHFFSQEKSILQHISPQAHQPLQLLQNMLLSQPDHLLGKNLARIGRMIGLDMEALLAQGQIDEGAKTLKGILLALSQGCQDNSPEAKERDSLVKTIEMWQIFQLRLAEKGLFFLPLPLAFLEQGYMLVGNSNEEDKAQDTAHKSFWLSLHLRLSALGNIDALLSFEQSGCNIHILCETVQVAQYMSQFKRQFIEQMEQQTISNVIIDVGAKDPERNLLSYLQPDCESFLNAMA